MANVNDFRLDFNTTAKDLEKKIKSKKMKKLLNNVSENFKSEKPRRGKRLSKKEILELIEDDNRALHNYRCYQIPSKP